MAIIGSLVVYGTVNHVLQPKESSRDVWKFKSFSIIENIHQLLLVSDKSRQDGFLQWFKMGLVLCGVCAHIMCCLESPIGFFVLSHHKSLQRIMSDPMFMPIFGDAGIVCITALR